MSNRYYLCPVVRDNKNRRQPSIKLDAAYYSQEGANLTPVIGEADDFCLVVAELVDHDTVGALSGVDLLPDYALDGAMTEMEQTDKLALRDAVVTRGMDGVSTVDEAATYRDVIETIAREYLNSPGFDADSFVA